MQADASPATPICRNPNKAEALPIFLVNGANAKAVAFGLVNPRQDNAMKNRAIVASRPYQLFQDPIRKIKPVTVNVVNATLNILSLENDLLMSIFNWLPHIKPIDKKAKIPPYTCGVTLYISIKIIGDPAT